MKNLLCRLFGHKWNYYKIGNKHDKTIRVCKHCGCLQEWKSLMDPKKLEWVGGNNKYSDFQAYLYIDGYGKE